jgi:hypothetical protein
MMDDVISPEMLHKGSADDVLIRRPRVALPLSVDEAALDAVEPAARAHLAQLYVPSGADHRRFALSQDVLKKCRIGAPDDADALTTGWDALRALPYQLVDPVVRQSFAHTADFDRATPAALADALFAHTTPIARATSCELINSGDHYFFYRKIHEHVPGTMFIEAARQAVYYHLYTQTRHVRGNVTLSLGELNATFHAYAELMYPVEIVVDDLGNDANPLPRQVFYRASFYQRQTLLATIDTKGPVINVELFKKIRNALLFDEDWFEPLEIAPLTCAIVTEDGARHDTSLLGISRAGCVTADVADLVPSRVKSIDIAFDRALRFSASIEPIRDETVQPTWKFVDLPMSALHDLKEIIKRGFVFLDPAALDAARCVS